MTLPAQQAERTICFSQLEKFDEVNFITESRRWKNVCGYTFH